MTFVHADEENAQEPGPSGDHVVVLAPKRGGTAQQERVSFLDAALQRRAGGTAGRWVFACAISLHAVASHVLHEPLHSILSGVRFLGVLLNSLPAGDTTRQDKHQPHIAPAGA